MRVLVIDNYDSFVYNLVQYLGELGAEPVVHRNDAVTLPELQALEPDAVLVSPGPGSPDQPGDGGVSIDAIREGSVPDMLKVSARSESGIIMGVRHKTLPVEGVQFHPESILTPEGHDILRNFLQVAVVS